MTPMASPVKNAFGVTTARALIFVMAGVLLLMCASSLHRIPSHEARCGPIGRDGFEQPVPGMFGRKGDALGLAGLDCERVEPERLPAVIEAVEHAEMGAMQAEDGCDLGAVGQRQHDDAPGLGAKGRLW